VKASAPALVVRNRRHDHPHGKRAIPGKRKMLAEERALLGVSWYSGEPVLVTKYSRGGVSEVCFQTVEHHGSVRRHCGQAVHSITRFGAEFSESIDQAETHSVPPSALVRDSE
jgi:hypothetical protein